MSIALYTKGWDQALWLSHFQTLLPNHTITAMEAVETFEDIRYAMVWKPEPGALARFPNLEVIFSLGAGVDFLLNDPSLPNVPVVRVVDPDLTNRMSEYVVLHCLLHHRRTLSYLRYQQAGLWMDREDPAAKDIRLGILGLGVLGQDAAYKLSIMGYDVMGWSRSQKDLQNMRCFSGEAGLDAMLSQTDILVSLLPHTQETHAMLNLDLFKKLPRDGALGGPVLINAGRGKVQVERDIMKALDDGLLIGASLDVFEDEPLHDSSPLWSHPNVILTPHNAAASSAKAITDYVVRQLSLYEAGQAMDSVVNRDAGY
ncbi:MAG: glyoxylate/hydroxypyruvate reductase A [Cohaesibacter sp.]|nr:glyoxylate/hydroxypyruvate reductase A [Cohaesibacter sp.]